MGADVRQFFNLSYEAVLIFERHISHEVMVLCTRIGEAGDPRAEARITKLVR
jgi:hypothetical protein